MKRRKLIFRLIFMIIVLVFSLNSVSMAKIRIRHSSQYKLADDEFDIYDGYIYNVFPGTTLETFTSGENFSGIFNKVKVYRGEEELTNKKEIIKTGDIANLNGSSYCIMVYGDLNKDGKYTYKDVLVINSYVNGGGSGDATGGEYDPSVGGVSAGYIGTFTCGERVYKNYKQTYYNGAYRYNGEWSGCIASGGCGVTAAAIIATGFGVDIDPPGMAAVCYNSQRMFPLCRALEEVIEGISCYAFDGYVIASDYGQGYGDVNSYESNSNVMDKIIEQLENGYPTIVGTYASANGGNNPFTNNAHWMAVLAISEDGEQIFISNPNVNSGRTGWWDIEEVRYMFADCIIIEG